MRILYLSQYFPPEVGATQTRAYEMAQGLLRAGHQVTMLTEVPNHPEGVIRPEYRGRFWVRETLDGIDVIRVWVKTAPVKTMRTRLAFYISYMLNAALAGLLLARGRYDVIYATSPPLFVGGAALALSYLRRIPLVFEVRDLWPESAIDTGVLTSRALIWLSYRLEELAYRRAAWVNVLTPAFERALVETKGVSPKRISMIPNGADLDIMKPGPKDNHVRKRLGLQDKFVVSYFGAHGRANRVGQLLDVAERLKGTHPDVRIMLVGDGMEKPMLVEDARRRNLDNVIFVDAVPKDEVCDYINASDICTAVLMKNDTFKTVYPNKVFDYMSCRRPVIVAIDGVARKLVADAGAGLYAEPENPEAFIEALLKLKGAPDLTRQMGDSGYIHARDTYSRESMAGKYLDVLKRLATAQ